VGPPGDEERGGSNGFVISNVIFVVRTLAGEGQA
jgi:hypothetical protein